MLKKSNIFLSRALLFSAIALLSGCKPMDWFKGGSCSSCSHGEDVKIEGIAPEVLKETVVSFDGKPEITGHDVEKHYQMIINAQPGLKDMLAYLPEAQQELLFGQIIESLAMEKVMARWLRDSGMDKDAEFSKNADLAHRALDRDLAFKAFENKLLKEIVIADEELKQYFEANKDKDPMLQRPPFVITAGGVKAHGVIAAHEKEAHELADKARKGLLATVAKEAKKKLDDYGMVNAQSFALDGTLRDKILSATKFPSIEVVKGADGKIYVVRIISRQETKFGEFDKIKDALKQVMTGKRFNEIFTKKMEELKAQYKMENKGKDYIQKRKPKTVEAAVPAEASKDVEAPKAAEEAKPEAAPVKA